MTSTALDRRERARLRFGVHTVLVFVATVVLGIPFAFLVLLVGEKSDWLQTLDRHTAADLHSFGARHSAFVTAMRVVSDVGSPAMWWILIVPVAVLLVRRGARRRAAFVVVTAGGSWLLNQLVKATVARTRPHLLHAFATARGASFPSGHAQAATVACGVLLIAGWPYLATRWRVLGVVVGVVAVVMVSFSRIALGVHYLSDVVAAAILGIAWLLLMTAAFTAWQHDVNRPSGQARTP